VDFISRGVNSGEVGIGGNGQRQEVPNLLTSGEDARLSIVNGSLFRLMGPGSLRGVQKTVSGASSGGREDHDGVRRGHTGDELDVGVGSVDVGDTSVNENGKAVAIEDADSLLDLGGNLLRDECRDDLEVPREAELEWEVPFNERNQRPQAPDGILLGEGDVEGSLVLDQLVGEGLKDAAGLRAGLGELVEGVLALEFDGITGGSGLVPGHGWTPCEVGDGTDSKGVARGAPPGTVVVGKQVGISVLAKSDFRDRTGVDEWVETKDVGRLLASKDGEDVEEEALSVVVKSHLDYGGLRDDEVLVGTKIVDRASSGLRVLDALVETKVRGDVAVFGLAVFVGLTSVLSFHQKYEAGLSERVLDFSVEAGVAHSGRGIIVYTSATVALGTNGLVATLGVGDTVRGAGCSIECSLKRETKNTMSVAVHHRTPKVGLRATS